MHNFIKVKDLDDGVKKIFDSSSSIFTDKKQIKIVYHRRERFGESFVNVS